MNYARDLASAYNQRLAEKNPRRADEIEWYVSSTGDLKLRDLPEWSQRRGKDIAQNQEYQRQEWLRRNQEGQYTNPYWDSDS